MKIYFAGSIRGGRKDIDIYKKIIEYLNQKGIVFTEHIGDYRISINGETNISDKEIYFRDIEWIKCCDFFIAEVSNPSLGVGYEIAVAENEGKSILCLCLLNTNLSAMIAGNEKLVTKYYKTFQEIKKHIDSFLFKIDNQLNMENN